MLCCFFSCGSSLKSFSITFQSSGRCWKTLSAVHFCFTFFTVSRCQFHQHFTSAFIVQKSFLCLEFGFEWTFVQKMRVKCWWNWRLESILPTHFCCYHVNGFDNICYELKTYEYKFYNTFYSLDFGLVANF